MNREKIRHRAEKDHAVLPSEVIDLLDALEEAIGLLLMARDCPTVEHNANLLHSSIEAFLTTHGASDE